MKNKCFIIFLFFCPFLLAQEDLPTGSVVVEKDVKIQLLDQNKSDFNPSIIDERVTRQYDLSIAEKQFSVKYPDPTIKSLGIRANNDTEAYSQYLKLGIGLPQSLIGEAALNYDIQDETKFRTYLSYLNINDKKYENRKASRLIGNIGINHMTYNDHVLDGEIDFSSRNYQMYGYDHGDTTLVLSEDSLRNEFLNISLGGSIRKTTDSEDPLEYFGNIYFNQFRNQIDLRENNLQGGLGGQKWFGNLAIGLDLDGSYLTNIQDTSKTDFSIVRILPKAQYRTEDWYIRGALNLAYYSNDFNVFPRAEFGINILGSSLQAYAGLDGNAQPLTYQYASLDNPFLVSYWDSDAFMSWRDYYGGVKGNISNWKYQAQIGIKDVNNLMMFEQETENQITKYNLLTDTANVFYFRGNVEFPITEDIMFIGGLQSNVYDMKNEDKAWYLPNIRVNAGVTATFLERITAKASFAFADKGSIPVDEESEDRKINNLIDFNLGAEGYITDNIGLFLDINNLFGTNYARFYDYQSVGLNTQFGVVVRF